MFISGHSYNYVSADSVTPSAVGLTEMRQKCSQQSTPITNQELQHLPIDRTVK